MSLSDEDPLFGWLAINELKVVLFFVEVEEAGLVGLGWIHALGFVFLGHQEERAVPGAREGGDLISVDGYLAQFIADDKVDSFTCHLTLSRICILSKSVELKFTHFVLGFDDAEARATLNFEH